MIKTGIKNDKLITLSAVIGKAAKKDVIKKDNVITEDIKSKKAFAYFSKDLTKDTLKAFAKIIAKPNREYQIDIKSFVSKKVSESEVVRILVDAYMFINAQNIYNVKTSKKVKPTNLSLLNLTKEGKASFKKTKLYAEAVNYVRNLQVTPPNVLNSVVFANKIKKDLAPYKNLSVKVLTLKEIKALKMGLLLSVNAASKHEARVVVVEYKGDTKTKAKTALIGKGIMFDAGGMNIKTGKFMLGMKYDMSGAAIAIGAMKTIAQTKPKKNFSAVVALTDNVVSNTASLPDSVYTAMNGKTVEVNNTDAEGRLVMADALTYAAKKLKATRLIDIATLTGAIGVALGHTYTGVWSTTEKGWNDIKKAGIAADENLWRLPLHKDYFKFMKGSKISDMYNTDYSGKGGSSSAAMFLTQFNEGVEHIHLDIAGTAEINGECMGPIVKTLVELTNVK